MFASFSSSRTYGLIVGICLAAAVAIKFSPVVGGVALASICSGFLFSVQLSRLLNSLLELTVRFDARARKWSGRSNWATSIFLSSMVYFAGFTYWTLHLIGQNWDGKETLFAVLIGIVSLGIFVGLMRRGLDVSIPGFEKSDFFDQLCNSIFWAGAFFCFVGFVTLGLSIHFELMRINTPS